MNAKKEANELIRDNLANQKLHPSRINSVVNGLVRQLEATERKLAKAEKVINEIHMQKINGKILFGIKNRDNMREALSDYEASKEYTSQEVGGE